MCQENMAHDDWHNEQYMSEKRREVTNVAQLLRDKKINVVEGAMKLNALRHELSQKDFDEDFMLFVAISSETDHLPVGHVREQYSSAALQKADAEIHDADKFYRSQVVVACEKLIARFGNDT